MPVYEYKGKSYELNETDPVAAKARIQSHLGESSEDLVAKIPTPPVTGPSGGAAEEKSLLSKFGEYASQVGPMGVATGTALKLAGKAPQAMGALERGARTFAQAMTPQTGKQLAQMTAGAGIAGASGEYAAQRAKEAGAPEAIAETARVAGEVGPSMFRTAARRALAPKVESMREGMYTIPENIRSEERQRVLSQALQTGMQPLPSQIKQSRALSATERVMQLVPGSREEFIKFGRENQAAANRAVAKAFGGVEPTLAPRAMRDADEALSNEYNKLLSGKQINVDNAARTQLVDAFERNASLNEFRVGSPRVSAFAEALQAKQQIPAPLWKEVRSEVAQYVYSLEGAPKQVGMKVLQQFDDIAKRSLGKEDYEALRGIDKQYAALKAFEDAYARNPRIIDAGDVDINKFAQQYASVEPTNVLYGRERGRGGDYVPLAESAQSYNIFTRPRIPQTEATTLGGLLRAGTGLSLMGGGLAGDVPYLPAAGAAMLAAPPVARKMAQMYLAPEDVAARMRQTRVSPTGVVAGALNRAQGETNAPQKR